MSITDELIPVLKKLRLSGVLKTLDLRMKEAEGGEISHNDFLFRICCDEVQRREVKGQPAQPAESERHLPRLPARAEEQQPRRNPRQPRDAQLRKRRR